MAYFIRTGIGGIIAMILFIPLLILLTIFVPVMIIVVLLIAAAAGFRALIASKARSIMKKDEKNKARDAKGIIDVEYKIK